MSKLRLLDDFRRLWERRTTFVDQEDNEFNLLSVPDLVQSKKTARTKDWPVIELLVDIHIQENLMTPRPDWIRFWLCECRNPAQLIALAYQFGAECRALAESRPLLAHALTRDRPLVETALDAEMRAEQNADRLFWEPIRRELEAMRFDEAKRKRGSA
jgi:hypothetical protein